MALWAANGPEGSSSHELGRRVADVTVSSILLLLAIPVIVLTAFGSALALRAWPFFTQERVGRNGQTFRFIKVRTLPVSTPAYTDKHQLEHERIPRLCRVLRRLHLDELPQLLLVLQGHMSLVGPRPEMAHLHEQLPASFAGLRTSVRPGCTGLWQVSEACTGLIGDAPEYDRLYVTRRTWRLDAWIAGRTALKMVGLAGPVRYGQIPRWSLASDAAVDTIDLRQPARTDLRHQPAQIEVRQPATIDPLALPTAAR